MCWHQQKAKKQYWGGGRLKGCVWVTVTVSEEKQLFEERVAGENQDAPAM